MITKFKKSLEPLIAIISKPFLFIHPNILTIVGLLFPILFFILVIHHRFIWSLIMCLGFFFDAIDGYVARQQNKITVFGGILDSSIDRISDGIMISAFGFANLVPWSLVISALITTFLISYIKARGEKAAKITIVGGIMQRTERILVLLLGVLLFSLFHFSSILFSIFILLCILNIVTILQRFLFLYRQTHQ